MAGQLEAILANAYFSLIQTILATVGDACTSVYITGNVAWSWSSSWWLCSRVLLESHDRLDVQIKNSLPNTSRSAAKCTGVSRALLHVFEQI